MMTITQEDRAALVKLFMSTGLPNTVASALVDARPDEDAALQMLASQRLAGNPATVDNETVNRDA